MSSAVPNIRQDFLAWSPAPGHFSSRHGLIVNAAQDEVDDEEHEKPKRLTRCCCVTKKPGEGTSVVCSKDGGVYKVWFDFIEETVHERQEAKHGEENRGTEADGDDDESTYQ